MSTDYNTDTVKDINYESIRIGLASPEKIREWSRAEVKKAETINYRTLKPEKDGLFCEKIFGPSKDWECHCGKYKKIRFKGTICDKCGVEVTKASVRRERMGHIDLAAPVSHIWYFKGNGSMSLILNVTPKNLEKVLYFASYIVLDPGTTSLEKKQILSEREYNEAKEKWPEAGAFRVGMGAEAIYELLQNIDVEKECKDLREELEKSSGQKREKIVKRLETFEAFSGSGNKPEWMILQAIPVLPPDLRPMVQLDGGRFATSDMNDLYRRIINRNNRLKKLLTLGTPELIVRNEKRMLQEAVDALIDNGRRGRAVTGPGNRNLKSLSDLLKGKQGRFRQNLLGKRVDYSGRSVIVVGPELKIYQCGLPKEMAIELFKPFVMKELNARGIATNIKQAKKMVEKLETQVWDILEDVIHEHPVMLNRAPTLHRLGIQAFEPILVEGKAIKLHPLVCTAFNADFDGDQMAVHLPLSVEAQAEARFLMLSPNNLLKPSDGGPVAVPTQDMVLGIYYLTLKKETDKGAGTFYKNTAEAILAYENGYITLQSPIKVRREGIWPATGEKISKVIDATLGRLILNEAISQDLGFVDRSKKENFLDLEVDFLVKKKQLKGILEKCINNHGAIKTAETLDAIKSLGYKYSTRAAMTVSISDMTVPPEKKAIIAQAEEAVEDINYAYLRGEASEENRHKSVLEIWKAADEEIKAKLMAGLDKYNNINMMADSGARGSVDQIKQLAGWRGLMQDTSGKTIELPVKANFREGLDVLEYFISAHGARKGLSDTALRTADSGYLTRRLVDVAQDQIIRENDCCEGAEIIPGMEVRAITEKVQEGDEKKSAIEELKERITGRFACEDMYDDNGEIIVKKNHMITSKRAERIVETKAIKEKGFEAKVKIRTVLTCRSRIGICAKCYGANMATGEPVQVGEAVGVIAAQSIGEPGTQLTMRTFHMGGVAGDDITHGLPRVEELFEARKPKGLAIISDIAGTVSIKETRNKKDNNNKREVVVSRVNEDGSVDAKTYTIPYGSHIKVQNGQNIEAGDELTEGSIHPRDILEIKGLRAVQDYMIEEVQKVYRLQSVEINDKHIEIIVRQMLKKVQVSESGDTDLLPGTTVNRFEFEDAYEKAVAEGKKPAEGKDVILGITKAALATDSFLSAASFQETTKVLTDAAIRGSVDKLFGLKENVIIGKLIPAGTGMKAYRKINLSTDAEFEEKQKADRLNEQFLAKQNRNRKDDSDAVYYDNEDDDEDDELLGEDYDMADSFEDDEFEEFDDEELNDDSFDDMGSDDE